MLISNKKQNIFKKISLLVSFFVLIFSFVVPLKTFSANDYVWAYGISTQANANVANDNLESFKTKTLCETDRNLKIKQAILENKTWGITICVKPNKIPDEGIKVEKLNTPFIPIENFKPNYYFEYLSSTNNTYNILGPWQKEDCKTQSESLEKAGKGTISKPCFKSETRPIATVLKQTQQQNQPKDTDTVYTPLAPLPDPDTGKLLESLDTKGSCAFGTYLNIIIKIFFGICAALAMLMIIIGGIQYMTSELMSSKESAKESITHAIFGFLLALSAYLILNTLNPDLLNACLKMDKATITIQEENETADSAVLEPASNDCIIGAKTPACPGGLVKRGNFVLCSSIADNVIKMTEKARAEGIILTGGSCRSTQAQKRLRIKNCGENSNSCNVKASCNPATACPGSSRHENGLAIDFRCPAEGGLIKSTNSTCFKWLKNNSNIGGLKNLKTGTEPWHWSTDGR